MRMVPADDLNEVGVYDVCIDLQFKKLILE